MRSLLLLCSLIGIGSCVVVYVGNGTDSNCTGLFYTEIHMLKFNALTEADVIDLAAEKNTETTCTISEDNKNRYLKIKYTNQARIGYEDIALTYAFYATDTGYWGALDVTLQFKNETITIQSTEGNIVSTQFSYACTYAQNNSFTDADGATVATLKMERYQYQLWGLDTDPSKPYFYDSFQCINFISKGAWMGIVAGVLMITVVILSILMLLNTTTPDRFETSKSKCLIIPHEH